MRWEAIVRVAGILGVVAAYALWLRLGSGNLTALLMILFVIAAIIGPEVVDALPFGPAKGE